MQNAASCIDTNSLTTSRGHVCIKWACTPCCQPLPSAPQNLNTDLCCLVLPLPAALAMGLCVAMIAFVRLPSLKVSCLLLSGLLIYDVFWVRCTSTQLIASTTGHSNDPQLLSFFILIIIIMTQFIKGDMLHTRTLLPNRLLAQEAVR